MKESEGDGGGKAHKPVFPCLAIQKARIILDYIVSSRPAWSTGGSVLKMRNLEREERREEKEQSCKGVW